MRYPFIVPGILLALAACGGHAAASTPPAAAVEISPRNETPLQQGGQIPCDSVALGMTFRYSAPMTRERPRTPDPTVFPTVGTVCAGSAAQRAGLMSGDVLLELNGRDFRDRAAREALRSPPGTLLLFRVRRPDGEHEIPLRVPARASQGSR